MLGWHETLRRSLSGTGRGARGARPLGSGPPQGSGGSMGGRRTPLVLLRSPLGGPGTRSTSPPARCPSWHREGCAAACGCPSPEGGGPRGTSPPGLAGLGTGERGSPRVGPHRAPPGSAAWTVPAVALNASAGVSPGAQAGLGRLALCILPFSASLQDLHPTRLGFVSLWSHPDLRRPLAPGLPALAAGLWMRSAGEPTGMSEEAAPPHRLSVLPATRPEFVPWAFWPW